ncbi:MAG: glutathionylspermidine synthase family protein [Planctomycetaceae bacterium]|nr:glutathionylspermidine synthase family protein [Planctomycetaceae bacterium]
MKSFSWQMSPDEFVAYQRQLRFRYQKWDSFVEGKLRLLPESLVLSAAEHDRIVHMAERLASILRRIEQQIKRRPDLLERLGIPATVREWIQQEATSDWQLARYDFFPTPDGRWQVCEFNEDVPGGFNEIISANRLLQFCHPNLRFVDRFAEALLAAVPAPGKIALMYATGYAEDLQHMVVLQQLLRERGQESVLCSPRHLHKTWRGFTVCGEQVVAGIRFYPGEWFGLLENQHAWRHAVRTWRMLNPLTRLITQSKAIFALWEENGVVDSHDLEFLRELAPATYEASRYSESGGDWSSLETQRQGWVLKQNFGRMGDNVVMGGLVSDAQWTAALNDVRRRPQDWIIQRCFEVAPVNFSNGAQYPALGAYLINGRFVGYYSRVAPAPFHTHQAIFVPTVIDDR